jgi:hypothetical protein
MAAFARELLDPPGDPYRAAAAWLEKNAGEGRSVWVVPDHMTYPLMFHAPRALYAWQLDWPPRPGLEGLEPIHYRWRVPPELVLAFGPFAEHVERELAAWPGAGGRYERVAVIDHYWQDLHRPELFWRRSRPVTAFDREREAVYVLARRPAR